MTGNRVLVWVEDGGRRCLAFRGKYTDGPEAIDASLEELAALCEHEAEGDNYSQLQNVHRLLAALLCTHVGRAKATDLFRRIAQFGGLHGLARNRDALAELEPRCEGK